MPTYTQQRTYRDLYGNVYGWKYWNRQPKPYVRPLSYQEVTASTLLNTYGDYKPGGTWISTPADLHYDDKVSPENAAAAKLLASITDKANLAVAVAERRQTMVMVSKRLTQLTKFVKEVKKGRFIQAAKTLGIKKPKGASRSKQFADNFLEYHFGWSPLIGDLYSAADILQQPIKHLRARGRGFRSGIYSSGSYPAHPPGNVDSMFEVFSWSYRVQTGCRVSAINSDLWLANQLGLVNPAVILWETIPFSFVLDWFTGFGSFLEGLTGTVGLTIEDGYTTRSFSAVRGVSHQRQSFTTGFWTVYSAYGFSRMVDRTQGHLTPKPTFHFPRVSPTRAITALSLLIQQMKR